MKDQFEIHKEKHELLPFLERHDLCVEESTSRARFWRYIPMAWIFCLLLLFLALMRLEPPNHCEKTLILYVIKIPLLQGTLTLTTYSKHRHCLLSMTIHTSGPDSTTLISSSTVGPSPMMSTKTGEIFFVVG